MDKESLSMDDLELTKTHIPKHGNIRGAETYH
jgi:hypothetical protein